MHLHPKMKCDKYILGVKKILDCINNATTLPTLLFCTGIYFLRLSSVCFRMNQQMYSKSLVKLYQFKNNYTVVLSQVVKAYNSEQNYTDTFSVAGESLSSSKQTDGFICLRPDTHTHT